MNLRGPSVTLTYTDEVQFYDPELTRAITRSAMDFTRRFEWCTKHLPAYDEYPRWWTEKEVFKFADEKDEIWFRLACG